MLDPNHSDQLGARVVVQLELRGVQSDHSQQAILEVFEGRQYDVLARGDNPGQTSQFEGVADFEGHHPPQWELTVLAACSAVDVGR